MKFARPALALTIALAALPLAGCAVDATDEDVEIDFDAEQPSLEPEYWTIGDVASSPIWDSGEINNLSPWLYAKCNVEYGDGYLLTGLDAWKESTGNLDNFIGKMSGVCSEYALLRSTLPQTGAVATKNIFTSTDYRAGVFSIDIPTTDAYPIGLDLRVNNTDGYVKDVRLIYAHKTVGGMAIQSGSPYSAGWATDYTGSIEYLRCGDQEVVTGVQLKYDTDKGKIRKLQIFCRTLINN